MNTVLGAGFAITALSLVGYAIGVLAPYPGRELSLTGVMVGITLLSISWIDGVNT
ncbi:MULTISPECIES: hypothetical protein [unclassified Haladaptatus]|uniref:hypothetical protein n=1 Tax=unclassified Haladaptatus TaxID=2622732 RepID=UPI0023E7E4C1|nr:MULTISPECIES: hypothetical protein [unclassified Haladaptatus]